MDNLELTKRIAKEKTDTWMLRLINKLPGGGLKTKNEFKIYFRIPFLEKLEQVDNAFVETLVVDDLNHRHLDSFLNETKITRTNLSDGFMGCLMPPEAPTQRPRF